MGEVKAFPFERCPKVTRAEMNMQLERQRVRIGWWWLAERMAESFARAQPGWGWRVGEVKVDGPVLQGEVEWESEIGRGSHVQTVITDAERSLMLIHYEPLLIASLVGFDSFTADALRNGIGVRWNIRDLAYLDALTADALADAEARLPSPGCGLRLTHSSARLDRQLRFFRSRELIVVGRVGFVFCLPGGSPRIGYARFLASRRCLRTAFGDALMQIAIESPLYWLPRGRTQVTLRLVFGGGQITLESATKLTRGDVLFSYDGAAKYKRADQSGFSPCWLGWSSPHVSAWWSASLVIRDQNFALALSKEGPQFMSKEQPYPPHTDPPPRRRTKEPVPVLLDRFVSDAPVEISFELTRIILTTEQLALAHAGDILELDLFLRSPIQVMLGSQRIAEGELVDVDGKLGVRLLWVGDKRDDPEPQP